MKRISFIILILLLFVAKPLSLKASKPPYDVHRGGGYIPNMNEQERILFILDFSGSMTERLDGVPKYELMLKTMREILPKINPNTSVGLRVYGHKLAITPFDACRSSSLVSPVVPNGGMGVQTALGQLKPRGMTPITFSLKQAIQNDFVGFSGKKHIILLTDGGENCDESPCKYAMELVTYRKDVSIDVIAFNVDNAEDLAQLECAALVTSGKFHTANTAAELARGLNNSVNPQKHVEAWIMPNP